MVAQITSETFSRASLTPEKDPSDSNDVALALERARALEKRGDIREAVRWLQRAADQAEKDDNDIRVLALARAAADMTNEIAPTPVNAQPRSAPPTSSPRPLPPARPLSGPPRVATPPRTSSPPTRATHAPPVPSHRSTRAPVHVDNRATEPTLRVATIRVAIPASGSQASVFVVRKLEKGQPPPAGTVEATLVLTPSNE